MTTPRRFAQVDVFGTGPLSGNALAVVLDGSGLDEAAMLGFARWTNLSETTFLLPPGAAGADYRVRIFTSTGELPFAGHPTLGSCHAWLEAGGRPADGAVIRQECGAGTVTIRRGRAGRLAFAAPPLVRSGPVEPDLVGHLAAGLGVDRRAVVDSQWVDNGPGWVALLLGSADEVLALRPGRLDHDVGVIGPRPPGSPEAFEVRAFTPSASGVVEDPVTGSLNAGLAGWLLASGRATAPFQVRQGTALGRAGRVHLEVDGEGVVWTGGSTATVVAGEVRC